MSKKKKIILISSITTVMIIVALATGFFSYRVKLVTPASMVELGDEVSVDPFDYLEGFKFAVERSEIDISEVDNFKVGAYEVNIKHAWQNFTVSVTIQDTTPPELNVKEDVQYLLNSQTYIIDEFVNSAKDLSGNVETVIRLNDSISTDRVSFTKNGNYKVIIIATDINDNYTVKSVDVIVDTPPEFGGEMPDYYLAVGSEIDYLDGLTAWDEHDGDLTDKIVVDTSEIHMEEAGEYKVFYSVTDEYGFESTITNTLHVYEKPDLQQLINTHQINRKDQTIIGAYNLYDGGVYEEDNIDFVLEEMTPAFVCLRYSYSNGGYSRGSGYIVEINEDEIIICNNEHVVHGYKTMDVYFYDGTKAKADIVSTGGGTCTEVDIAFAKVSRDQLTEEFMDTLKTVHIDEGYWTNLPKNPNISAGVRCVLTEGKVWHEKTGKLTVKKDIMCEQWRKYGLISHVTVQLIPGVSGSAILDGHGNLVAMAVGHGKVDGVQKYFAITLDNIIKIYEKYIGHKPNYM